jgi:hypothetical protein
MRKIIIFTSFLIIFFTFNSEAQDFWEKVDFFDTIGINNIGFISSGKTFIATIEGVFKSENNGENWELTSLNDGACCLSVAPDDAIYVISMYNSNLCLYKSVNEGNTWDSIHIFEDNIPFNNNASYISLNYIMIYGAMGGIYKSADSGYTWTQVLSTVNVEVFNDINEKDSLLFAGSVNWIDPNAGGVYRSFDQGDTWELSGLIGYGIYSFAIDTDSNLLAGVHVAPLSSYPGIYRCTDQAVIWENIYNQAYIGPVVVDPFGGIYAGLSATMGNNGWGIRFSDDNGIAWTDLSSGMQYCIGVTGLAISPANYIYTTTYSPNQLYRSINPILGINKPDIKDKKHNIHVYPNPCYDRLFIKLEKEPLTNIIVEIFDFAGKSLIIRKYFEINNKEIQININNFPAGIYFLKINNEDISEIYKIIKN